jgi:putative tryptophan/tyrosine transport system substrate-binding protein
MARLAVTGTLLALLVALAVIFLAPLPADAQARAERPARIGFIGNADPKIQASSVEAFKQGLRELGLIEGQTLRIEYRWAEGQADRFPAIANEMVKLGVDVILATGSPALRAAREASSTIPIVTVLLIDPVDAGYVASHARPGGNVTGLASQYEEIVTKQVQLLVETVPGLSRIALLHHPSTSAATVTAAAAAASTLQITAQVLRVKDVAGFERAFEAARDARAQAMLVLPSPIFNAHRRTLIQLAARHRLPTLYEFQTYVRDGGLMSYGPSIEDMFRQAATFVARILSGAKPAELPIERPTKFELAFNLRTARALGLTIPQTLLIQADQLME